MGTAGSVPPPALDGAACGSCCRPGLARRTYRPRPCLLGAPRPSAATPAGLWPAASSHIGEHPATQRGDTLSPAAKCPCGPCGWVLIVAAKTVTFSHLLWCFTHSLFPQEKVPWMMQALRGARGKAVGEGPSGPACSFRASPGPRAGAEAPQNLRDSFVSEQGSFFKGF